MFFGKTEIPFFPQPLLAITDITFHVPKSIEASNYGLTGTKSQSQTPSTLFELDQSTRRHFIPAKEIIKRDLSPTPTLAFLLAQKQMARTSKEESGQSLVHQLCRQLTR